MRVIHPLIGNGRSRLSQEAEIDKIRPAGSGGQLDARIAFRDFHVADERSRRSRQTGERRKREKRYTIKILIKESVTGSRLARRGKTRDASAEPFGNTYAY